MVYIEDAVKLALEKLRSAVADVAGIAKYTFKFIFLRFQLFEINWHFGFESFRIRNSKMPIPKRHYTG